MSGSVNWLGSPPDPNNALNPFARRVMTNPIGTEVAPLAGTPTVGVPQGDFNALVGFGSGGAPITMADAVRAQGQRRQGQDVATTAVLGMTGEGGSPFDFRPSAGRTLPRDNYVKSLDAHSPLMFREEAPDEVSRLLSGQGIPFGRDEKFLADNPDIALGQGGNKGGIQLAFDASKIDGQVNRSKPAWDLGYQNGTAEYVGKDTTQNFRDALAGIRVPDALNLPRTTAAQVNRGLQGLLDKGWTKRTLDNGHTEYLPPAPQQ